MRKLEAQELRHARWDGWLLKTVEAECEDATWQMLGISTKARARRMKDAQFISELLLVVIEGRQAGFDQQAIDNAYAKYDDVEDVDPPIETDQVAETVASTKQYLLAMQSANARVKTHTSTFAVFYTLWSLVVLHRTELPDASEFGAIFVAFKERVDKLSEDPKPPSTVAEGSPEARAYARAAAFAAASRGATTDLALREKRLEALRAHLADLKA
jgi:hypothetical protein